jgi:hypothetical protein
VIAATSFTEQVAAQTGQHDLDLLLGPPAPVLTLLGQPNLLFGRAVQC